MVDMGRPGFDVGAYARSLEAAREIPGRRTVAARRTGRWRLAKGKTDLVLSTEAAESFRELGPEVIKRAAVVILID